MGERILTLGYVHHRGTKYEIELNGPVRRTDVRQIHLQSGAIRLELTEDEFVRAVCAFRLAAEKLRRMKRLE